ncbi:MAG: hypothetical protein ACFE0J_17580 [Elainellaceae cyanobacterium]
MALIRWEPFREMNSLRRQMDELFDNMNSMAKVDQGRMAPWAPAVELNETEDEMILRAEVLAWHS